VSPKHCESATNEHTLTHNAQSAPLLPAGGDASIRLKYVDDTQRQVRSWLSLSVAEFKRYLLLINVHLHYILFSAHFEADVDAGKCVRLIFRGQLLRDETRSLKSYGLHDDCTVHCHVSRNAYTNGNAFRVHITEMDCYIAGPQQQQQQPQNTQHHQQQQYAQQNNNTNIGGGGGLVVRFDIGNYMHLIFAAKFALLWLFFVMYPQYFDFSSFFSLVLCTGLYVAFVGVSFRRAHVGDQTRNNNNIDSVPLVLS
jgi:hypothetical protein